MQEERWKLVQEKASKSKLELEQLLTDDKFLTQIKTIAKKYQLELDSDTEQLIKYIAAGGYVQGIEKLLDRDWAVNQAIRFWAAFTGRGSTKQRAFEFVCELLGLRAASKSTGANTLINVAFDTLKAVDAEETSS